MPLGREVGTTASSGAAINQAALMRLELFAKLGGQPSLSAGILAAQRPDEPPGLASAGHESVGEPNH